MSGSSIRPVSVIRMPGGVSGPARTSFLATTIVLGRQAIGPQATTAAAASRHRLAPRAGLGRWRTGHALGTDAATRGPAPEPDRGAVRAPTGGAGESAVLFPRDCARAASDTR